MPPLLKTTQPPSQNTLIDLGYQRHYKIGNPFEWMEMISLQGKTNFFEKRVGEYSKSGVGVDKTDQIFALDTSF